MAVCCQSALRHALPIGRHAVLYLITSAGYV